MENTVLDVQVEDLKGILKTLVKLQDSKKELDELNKEIKMIQTGLDKEEKRYSSKQFHYQKNIPYLEKVESEYQRIKIDIDEINDYISQAEEKKKKIKTIKEFKAINKRIETLNQQKVVKENDFLDKTEELEFKKSKMEKIKESLEETKTNLEQKRKELDEIFQERKNDIKKVTTRKETIEKKLPFRVITIFNRIYRNKDQTALVSVKKNVCHGCFTLLPKQISVNLQEANDLVFCPFCSRILYHEKE